MIDEKDMKHNSDYWSSFEDEMVDWEEVYGLSDGDDYDMCSDYSDYGEIPCGPNNKRRYDLDSFEFPKSFVSFDFENLYPQRVSACSVGMVKYKNGIIVDKYSTKWVATLATLICSLGLFILILTSNSYVAGFGEMLIGFGSAFAFVLAVKAITQWFHAGKVAIMASLTMSVGCLGPVIGGPGVAYIVRSHNWLDVIRT